MSKYPGIVEIARPEDVVAVVRLAGERSIPPDSTAIELLRWLYRSSYKGEMLDPLFAADSLKGEHIRELYRAFADVLARMFNTRATINLPAAGGGL
jgi:hypothetical protein